MPYGFYIYAAYGLWLVLAGGFYYLSWRRFRQAEKSLQSLTERQHDASS